METRAGGGTSQENAEISSPSLPGVVIGTGTRGEFSILQGTSKKLFSDGLAEG
jgi:hypothetical protein